MCSKKANEMKYYFSDIVPKIQKFSRRLDEDTLLLNHNWIAFNDTSDIKVTYIFRKNGELIISEKGIGKKAKWENLGNQRLLIEQDGDYLLFNNSFYDESILVLNLDDTTTYAFFLNETKIGISFKSINQIDHYLNARYKLKEDQEEKLAFEYFHNLTFTEETPEKLWDLAFGTYLRIKISFSNGIKNEFYCGGNSGKYFYRHSLNGVVYCKDKQECIYHLYLHITKQI